MDLILIVTAVGAFAGLTLALASALAFADRKLHMDEDPRIEAVEAMLPSTNCGGCGYPGCRPFAEALVAGEVLPGRCTVATEAEQCRIADFLKVAVGAQQKQVARLACAGGANVSRHRAHYAGLPTCAAATLVSGGGKACFWGCLGLADCEAACDFDAITMNQHGLPVVDTDRCTACGDCVTACPKDLFSLQPRDHLLWVACRSQEEGDEILDDCEVACTACGRCAMDAPGLIEMRGNLPVIDYTKGVASAAPTQRCPSGAIVWLDARAGAVRGASAPKIIRKRPLRDEPT